MGTSVAALLVMGAAAFICSLATFDWCLFGSSPSDGDKVLWFTLLPAAAGMGGAFIARSCGGTGWRVGASATVACAFAALWVASGPASSPNSSTGEEGISAQSTLLWVSALYAVIVTVRRREVPPRRSVAVYALSVVSGIGGLLLVNADFRVSSLLASFAVWIILPSLAGLLLPRSGRATPR